MNGFPPVFRLHAQKELNLSRGDLSYLSGQSLTVEISSFSTTQYSNLRWNALPCSRQASWNFRPLFSYCMLSLGTKKVTSYYSETLAGRKLLRNIGKHSKSSTKTATIDRHTSIFFIAATKYDILCAFHYTKYTSFPALYRYRTSTWM